MTELPIDRRDQSGLGSTTAIVGLTVALLFATVAVTASPAWIPALGLQVVEIPLTARNPLGVDHGVRVLDVLIDSPAGRAGLRPGDLITDVAGANVTSLARLRHLVETVRDQSVVTLELVRDGQRLSRDIRLRPPDRTPRTTAVSRFMAFALLADQDSPGSAKSAVWPRGQDETRSARPGTQRPRTGRFPTLKPNGGPLCSSTTS